MKKLSFLLLSLLAVAMLTSCGNEEPVNKQTAVIDIDNRAIQGNQVVFSQGKATVELDFTNMNIAFSFNFKDVDGDIRSISSSVMKLRLLNMSTYEFNSDDNSLAGDIDLGTGMMYFSYVPGSDSRVYCTSHLLYAYTTTSITNPTNGNNGRHEQSAYLITPDAKGETCTMRISNFMANTSGAVDAGDIQYTGITMTPTADGYTITASEVESSYKGQYTITDLNATLDNQAKVFNCTFKCNGLDYSISGKLFPTN